MEKETPLLSGMNHLREEFQKPDRPLQYEKLFTTNPDLHQD